MPKSLPFSSLRDLTSGLVTSQKRFFFKLCDTTLTGRSLRSMARMTVPTLLTACASPLNSAVTPILP